MPFSLLNKFLIFLINPSAILLGILVYRNNPKGKLNRVFLLMVVFMLYWVDFAYLPRLLPEGQTDLALPFLKIAWFVTPLFFSSLYFLIIFLIQKEREYKFLNKIILFLGVTAGLITGLTNWILSGIKYVDTYLSITYGKGMLPFLGIIFFITCGTLYVLIKNYLVSSSKEKVKIEYFLIGSLIFYIANIVFNITLPLLFHIVRFYWIGDYSTIFLLGFTAFAIVKRELFEIKIVLTLFFVALIAILLTLDLFVFTKELWLQIIKGGILIIFLFLGYSLVNSTLREIKLREELQKAYGELRILNETLEEKVKERTKELEIAKNLAEERTRESEKRREDLERFFKLTIGRELRMVELKQKIKELEERLKKDKQNGNKKLS